jgi:hypothetical protein
MLANLKIICQFHAHSVHQNDMERSPNYGRNNNITNGLNFMHRKWHTGNQYMVKSAENRMRSNLELLPVMNIKKWLKIAVLGGPIPSVVFKGFSPKRGPAIPPPVDCTPSPVLYNPVLDVSFAPALFEFYCTTSGVSSEGLYPKWRNLIMCIYQVGVTEQKQ